MSFISLPLSDIFITLKIISPFFHEVKLHLVQKILTHHHRKMLHIYSSMLQFNTGSNLAAIVDP